ncbi:MAG TPA: 50S ribosomal protein L25 [Candidatus Limnocylindrales bacterium]|nr:50S ribosomal protein L25 [Candidatus Limnocylindrales bacterium]
MAETYTLEAQARTITGKKVSQLRRDGLVPAVVYGSKIDAFNVQIPYRALQLTLLKAGGTNLINVMVDGNATPVLAREVQRSVLRGEIMHVDFLAVDMTQTIRAEIPVHLIGESPAVKNGLGVLVQLAQTLVIEALPADLINRVNVDISTLKNVNDAIHVSDLDLGGKVTIIGEDDEMLVRITIQEEETEEEAGEGEGTSAEPEVILKGKIEEDED